MAARVVATPRWRTLSLVTGVVLVTALSIALRLNSPAFLAAGWTLDDALYTKLAQSLLQGEWLGPYEMLTLSKGPGYPLFIAAAYKLHLPLKLAEHLVHLLAAGTMGLALARVSRKRAVGVVAHGAIALRSRLPGALGVLDHPRRAVWLALPPARGRHAAVRRPTCLPSSAGVSSPFRSSWRRVAHSG
jgi:hypothetical protein